MTNSLTGRTPASDPPLKNPLQTYIESIAFRFAVSAHLLSEVPREGLAALMEHPGKLDWYVVELAYTDTTGSKRTCTFIQWQQRYRQHFPAELYALVMPLIVDLDSYAHSPTVQQWLKLGVSHPDTATQVWELTRERGLMIADLLGPDLQSFMDAYADWVAEWQPVVYKPLEVLAL